MCSKLSALPPFRNVVLARARTVPLPVRLWSGAGTALIQRSHSEFDDLCALLLLAGSALGAIILDDVTAHKLSALQNTNLIFDYSSPFDVIKWRRVNKQFRRITDNRVKRTLYLDVLRMDITQILPQGVMGDGDFFRHPTCNLLAHHEHRSILLAAHVQWTTKEATKLLRAIQFFGKNAHTIMLDSPIAELCVAGQCTTDISTWFAFQAAAGGTDPTPESNGIQTPGWLQSEAKFNMSTYLSQSDGDLPQWNPTTQRIPLGPLFPKAKEITFRCTVPQIRRMRRLSVYQVPSTMIFSPEQLQVFRLSIIGGRSNAPANLKLRPFREWLDADQLGNKLCVQFC